MGIVGAFSKVEGVGWSVWRLCLHLHYCTLCREGASLLLQWFCLLWCSFLQDPISLDCKRDECSLVRSACEGWVGCLFHWAAEQRLVLVPSLEVTSTAAKQLAAESWCFMSLLPGLG